MECNLAGTDFQFLLVSLRNGLLLDLSKKDGRGSIDQKQPITNHPSSTGSWRP